jgi:hypothetical protein
MLFSGLEIEGTYSPTTGILYWDVPRTAVVKFVIGDYGIDCVKVIPGAVTTRLSSIA